MNIWTLLALLIGAAAGFFVVQSGQTKDQSALAIGAVAGAIGGLLGLGLFSWLASWLGAVVGNIAVIAAAGAGVAWGLKQAKVIK